jgi:hypothetical protein
MNTIKLILELLVVLAQLIAVLLEIMNDWIL